MGLFSTLMTKIFHHAAVAETPVDAAKPSPIQPDATAAPAAGASATAAAPAGPVDVAAILDNLAASNPEKLDWRHSIVDLMKLVGMDSGLHERRDLAADLKYTGDTNDTATMNIWLHDEVMRQLAANGGTVPPELLKY